jgi:hypothetical protein
MSGGNYLNKKQGPSWDLVFLMQITAHSYE